MITYIGIWTTHFSDLYAVGSFLYLYVYSFFYPILYLSFFRVFPDTLVDLRHNPCNWVYVLRSAASYSNI